MSGPQRGVDEPLRPLGQLTLSFWFAPQPPAGVRDWGGH